jgi:hypothetical protein
MYAFYMHHYPSSYTKKIRVNKMREGIPSKAKRKNGSRVWRITYWGRGCFLARGCCIHNIWVLSGSRSLTSSLLSRGLGSNLPAIGNRRSSQWQGAKAKVQPLKGSFGGLQELIKADAPEAYVPRWKGSWWSLGCYTSSRRRGGGPCSSSRNRP